MKDHVIASIRHHLHYTEVLRLTHRDAYRDVLLDVSRPKAALGHGRGQVQVSHEAEGRVKERRARRAREALVYT